MCHLSELHETHASLKVTQYINQNITHSVHIHTMSQQKNAKRKRAAPIPDINSTIFDKTDIAGIKDEFDKNGWAVVRLYDKQECTKHIAEIARKILLNQPWMEKLVVKDRTTGAILNIDRDEEKFVEELTKPNIPKETLKHYNDVWPMHKTFGACADPSAFHLDFQWELRQDEFLYAIARAIMQEHKLASNIDRAITKLSGNGVPEFLHWDFPILDVDSRPRNEKQPSISMKICFTEAEFIAVPGTHTRKFAEEFKRAYEPLYPQAKKTDAKFGLDPAKPDPMGLQDQKVAIKLPPGSAIIWSPYLMHGTIRSSVRSPIVFGTYAGFTNDGNRPGYQSDEPGITSEAKDRNMCYTLGRAPACYPSMDPVSYMPARLMNFPDKVKACVDKTPPGYAGRKDYVMKTGPTKGTVIQILRPVLDPNYVPYPLTKLGKQLLGIWPW